MNEQTKEILIWSAVFSAGFSFLFLALYIFIAAKIAQAQQKREAKQMQEAFQKLFDLGDRKDGEISATVEIIDEEDDEGDAAFNELESRQQTRQKPNNMQTPNGGQ